MCIIIDASVANKFFRQPPSHEADPVHRWISSNNGQLAYGGKNLIELSVISYAKRWLKIQLQAGRAKLYNASTIYDNQLNIQEDCKSNDAHIIALALISGARVLYCNDDDLEIDFKNQALLPPRKGRMTGRSHKGKIYKTDQHAHLLLNAPVCRT